MCCHRTIVPAGRPRWSEMWSWKICQPKLQNANWRRRRRWPGEVYLWPPPIAMTYEHRSRFVKLPTALIVAASLSHSPSITICYCALSLSLPRVFPFLAPDSRVGNHPTRPGGSTPVNYSITQRTSDHKSGQIMSLFPAGSGADPSVWPGAIEPVAIYLYDTRGGRVCVCASGKLASSVRLRDAMENCTATAKM